MTNKYSRDQWIIIAAALVFLTGAVFMLLYVFAAIQWAFIVGLSLALLASALMVWGGLDARKRVQANLNATAKQEQEDNG